MFAVVTCGKGAESFSMLARVSPSFSRKVWVTLSMDSSADCAPTPSADSA